MLRFDYWLAVIVCLITLVQHAGAKDVKSQIDDIFSNYMEDNDFHAAEMGVLVGKNLVYVGAKGSLNDDDEMRPHTAVPILDLSKAITTVAILQLVEDEYIDLNETVFTAGGLLEDFLNSQPNVTPDPRLFEITIGHLLTHSAGWDESENEVMDAMMNPMLLSLGYNVPNIKEEMGVEGDIDQYAIIQYVVSKPLQFKPGSRVSHSNVGYSILGRVVEAAVGEEYKRYVKMNILQVAGMWHTRIGAPSHRLRDILKLKYAYSNANANEKYFEQIVPNYLDSTLGWYSNVYDIARFFRALFDSDKGILLNKKTLEYGVSRFPELAKHHHFSWPGLGMDVQVDGSVIDERREINWGINVFMYREPGFEFVDMNRGHVKNNLRDIKTFIFVGFTEKPKKHIVGLERDILELNFSSLSEDMFIKDLTGIKLQAGTKSMLLNSDVSEHNIVTFTYAMKVSGYHPVLIHGYSDQDKTKYVTVFEKADNPRQCEYMITTSKSKAKLLKFVTANARQSYKVSSIQSFKSASHKGRLVNMVLLRRWSRPKVTMFNINEGLTSYNQSLQFAKVEGYQPVIQSIGEQKGQLFISYILWKPYVNTVHYFGITLTGVQAKIKENAAINFDLTYIDAYENKSGVTLFSVIFTQVQQMPQWAFETGIAMKDLYNEASTWSKQGYIPKFIIPYHSEQSLYFATYWQLN